MNLHVDIISRLDGNLTPWGDAFWYVRICIRLCPSYAEISHSCLAHIINIATQKFISTYSKSAFYEPDVTTDAEPEYNGNGRDVVGLIRATAVKVRRNLIQVLQYLRD